MEATWNDSSLTVENFFYYFNIGKLGNLRLPNGVMYEEHQGTFGSYREEVTTFLRLEELYKLIFMWTVASYTKISHKDVLAIIVFGSSVSYPGYTIQKKKYTYKKFIFFGKTIEESGDEIKVPIQPQDVDFIVVLRDLTSLSLNNSEIHTGKKIETGSYVDCLVNQDIHVTYYLFDEFKKKAAENDSVVVSSLKEGVVLFATDFFWSDTKIFGYKNKKRELIWTESPDRYLQLKVQ